MVCFRSTLYIDKTSDASGGALALSWRVFFFPNRKSLTHLYKDGVDIRNSQELMRWRLVRQPSGRP